jgi:hypothetical protein
LQPDIGLREGGAAVTVLGRIVVLRSAIVSQARRKKGNLALAHPWLSHKPVKTHHQVTVSGIKEPLQPLPVP